MTVYEITESFLHNDSPWRNGLGLFHKLEDARAWLARECEATTADAAAEGCVVKLVPMPCVATMVQSIKVVDGWTGSDSVFTIWRRTVR